jgi:hypothetical protein
MRDSNTSYWYEMRATSNSVRATRKAAALLAHTVLLGACACATGQTASNPMSVPAKQWATEAARNELKILQPGPPYLRYRMHTKNAKGDQVRDVIQSKDGAVARLILKDGRPLTAEEDAGEHERLQAMLDSPSAYAKHVKGDVSDRKLAHDLIQLLPEAMLYTYVSGQPQRADRAMKPDDAPEIVIDYKPNPAWSPPEIEADGLTGLEGRVWIDVKTHHMTRAEGTIFRGVNMAGFVAHIYEGGKLSFEQIRVSDQRWIFSKFIEHIELRVLFKRVNEDSENEASDFREVPAISYQDAIHALLATPLPQH